MSLFSLSDLAKVSAEELSLTVEMMRFLSWLISHSPTILREAQWDFVLCSVLAWLEVCMHAPQVVVCFVEWSY